MKSITFIRSRALAITLTITLILIAIAGCSSCRAEATPELHVDPAHAMYFGRVVVGTSRSEPLILSNLGLVTLRITDISLGLGPDSPFSIDRATPTAQTPLLLEPGDLIVVHVIYTPSAGMSQQDEDVLTIHSNDGRFERWPVQLVTSNTGPAIAIYPRVIDCSLQPNRSGPITVEVLNNGTDDTVLSELRLDGGFGPEFRLVDPADGSLRALLSFPAGIDLPVNAPPLEFELVCTATDASEPEVGSGIATLVAIPSDETHQAGTATVCGPPVAVAGEDFDADPLPESAHHLNGRDSRSLCNRISEYQWRLVSYPDGSEDATAFNSGEPQQPTYGNAPACEGNQLGQASPCFIPDVPGVYEFELQVADIRIPCELNSSGADPDPEANGCEVNDDCCSFQCDPSTATCDGTPSQGICHAGGCRIPGINTSVVRMRALSSQ